VPKGSIFKSVEKPRLSSDVARQIAQAIREGRYLPGDILPTERDLAVRFNVSRPILREALSILQSQSYITIKHGKGTYVRDPYTDILNVPLSEWLDKNSDLVEQFYEARIAIEPVCAALAAKHAGEKEIAELKDILLREEPLILNSDNVAIMVRTDIDFHSAISNLSGNAFLIKMLSSLIVPETDIRKIILRLPNHRPTTHEDHIRILTAIEQHDSSAAHQAMVIALNRPLEVVRDFMHNKE